MTNVLASEAAASSFDIASEHAWGSALQTRAFRFLGEARYTPRPDSPARSLERMGCHFPIALGCGRTQRRDRFGKLGQEKPKNLLFQGFIPKRVTPQMIEIDRQFARTAPVIRGMRIKRSNPRNIHNAHLKKQLDIAATAPLSPRR